MSVDAMRDYAQKGKIVQVKTINRFTGEESLFSGALIGNMAEKWQILSGLGTSEGDKR